MGYSREVYDAVRARLERRRMHAAAQAAALQEQMTSRYPRLQEIRREMAATAGQVTRAVISGGDVEAAVEEIKRKNLALQAEMAEILAKAGVKSPDFEPQYVCPQCRDTGYAGGKMCRCMEALLKEEACRRLSEMSAMELTDFDRMSLDYYPEEKDPRTGVSPRERMRGVLAYCRSYAENFVLPADSLLLRGPTGTGKTHAALAIARAAAERGFGVIYGPAQVLLHRIEKEHFGRAEGESEDVLESCDLLILDDLGTEFGSAFYTSCLYNIINTRMLSRLPTVISTNLTQAQLQERYGDQIASRITGTFVPLVFAGRDIRQLKNEQRLFGRGE